jgi:hypothetical protein
MLKAAVADLAIAAEARITNAASVTGSLDVFRSPAAYSVARPASSA